MHNLVLTRFLVAAQVWTRANPAYRLAEVRTGYELAKVLYETGSIVPDAWLLFERSDGKRFPVLLERDRGMEYQQKFKQHVGEG